MLTLTNSTIIPGLGSSDLATAVSNLNSLAIHDSVNITTSSMVNNKLTINGQGADIDINGVSLLETLKGLQDRLNILRPNKEIEAEWEQLRELGEQYRLLEAQLLEKTKMWETLKK